MNLTIKYFGAIADITNKKEDFICFENEVNSLHLVQSKIEGLYPEIKNITYSLALNRSLSQSDDAVAEGDEIAFLPPFAGG